MQSKLAVIEKIKVTICIWLTSHLMLHAEGLTYGEVRAASLKSELVFLQERESERDRKENREREGTSFDINIFAAGRVHDF